MALFVLMSAIATPSSAQSTLGFKRLTTEHGLSQSSVPCLLQDSQGFLWVCTQNGLNRYDGYRFKVYRQGDRGLTHETINSIAESPDGNLWIATVGGGVNQWIREEDRFVAWRHDPEIPSGLRSDRILRLTPDSSGRLWLTTEGNKGIDLFDPATGNVRQLKQGPTDPVQPTGRQVGAILEDSRRRIWVGTDKGLELYDPQANSFSIAFEAPRDPAKSRLLWVRSLAEDSRGRIWIGSWEWLGRFDPTTLRLERHWTEELSTPNRGWIYSIHQDRKGRLWIGTAAGLGRWLEEEDRITFSLDIVGSDPFDDPAVLSITEDRAGLLWLGTRLHGIGRLKDLPSLRRGILDHPDLQQGIYAVSEDADSNLWLGSLENGLFRISRSTGELKRYSHQDSDPGSLSHDRIASLLHDRKDTLWVGTIYGGLNRLDAGSTNFVHYENDPNRLDSLSANGITCLYEDTAGTIWAGTYGGGLNRYLGGDRFKRFRASENPSSLSDDRVHAIAEGGPGTLWLTTDGGGLNRMDVAQETFEQFRHDPARLDSLPSDELYSLLMVKGRLWIGTRNKGLSVLDTPGPDTHARFRTYNEQDGLLDPTILGMESDSLGRLWLGTNRGLIRFDPSTEKFRAFGTDYGLRNLAHNLGAHFRNASGQLFFGGAHGVDVFTPDHIRDNTVPPNVVLTDFTRFGETVALDAPLTSITRLELAHSDRLLAFEFSALDFVDPEQNQYRYRLKGLDDRWVEMKNRQVQLTSLNPGRYTLEVQGSNSDGVWSTSGPSIEISVAPPIWRSWWAVLSYLLTTVALVSGLIWARDRRAAEHRAELESLVARRTLELRERNSDLEVANHRLAEENLMRRRSENERAELQEQIEKIGRYRIEAKLGAGGMGEVYRGYDSQLDRRVAMKFIRAELLQTETAKKRFRRESKIVADIHHPAIVQVFDVIRWSDRECIVMEWVPGESLADHLKHGPWPVHRALPMFIHLLKGLGAAHTRGVVHRDLKAGNVMITLDDTPKILDFGIAKQMTRPELTLSRTGQVLGTLHTMSPEQARGSAVDQRSDLFSLGVLFYRTLTATDPFKGDNPLHTLTRLTRQNPTSIHILNKYVPLDLSKLIDRLLEKNPEHRPTDTKEVLASLEKLQKRLEREGSGIREVLKLLWAKKEQPHKVSRTLEVEEETVSLYSIRARDAGLSRWDELEELDDLTLGSTLSRER